jgi:hypothetical protein
MRSLEARLSRLEKKQKRANIPTKVEWQMAKLRHRRHRSTILRVRLYQAVGENYTLSESERRHVETPPEVVAGWEDIIARGDSFYGPGEEEKGQRASRTEELRRKILGRAEELQRVTVGGPG